MRRMFIAGNWKMHTDRVSAVALAESLADQSTSLGHVDLAICPPFVYLDAVARAIAGSELAVGAQNMYHEDSGAYTGEVSAAMLLDVGCKYVILGHSERRHLLGETDEMVNRKLLAAHRAGLAPIVCVGELLEQREAGQTLEVIRTQFEGSLAGLSDEQMARTVIAYEPVWAIGTGKVATPDQAQEVHADLRKIIAGRYNEQLAEKVVIQYGGSVKPDNAAELLGRPDIDGALVGGAALKAESFLGIVAGAKA